MRVLINTNYFWPEDFRINDLAVGLRERGHAVTVLTGTPNYPKGKFFDGYGLFNKTTEDYHGVSIIRYPQIPRFGGRSWSLFLNFMSAAVGSCLWALLRIRGRFDVIFVYEVSPVTVGLPAVLINKLFSTPIVFWVLDLWPETLSATNALKSERALKVVRRLVRMIYRRCQKILVSSKGFIHGIERTGGYGGVIEYFPNWIDPASFSGKVAESGLVVAMPSGFIVMFAGNIGDAQDFETILAAAEKTSQIPKIHWVVLGDGRRADWVKEQVSKRGLDSTVHLLGRFPSEDMPAFFLKANALLVTLRKDPVFALTVPGKIQSYLASGKPVIAALDGEGARLVDESGAGWTSAAGDADALALRVIEAYRLTPLERQKMGERGREFCHANFDRETLFNTLESLLNEAAGAARKPT